MLYTKRKFIATLAYLLITGISTILGYIQSRSNKREAVIDIKKTVLMFYHRNNQTEMMRQNNLDLKDENDESGDGNNEEVPEVFSHKLLVDLNDFKSQTQHEPTSRSNMMSESVIDKD